METDSKHPLRCETCKNVRNDHIGCEYFSICLKTNERVFASTSVHTAKVGCASHSDVSTKSFQNHNEFIDNIKDLLLNSMTRTEYDYNNYDYLGEHTVREIMDALYIPPRLNTLCKYEYSCGSYGSYNSCKTCKNNKRDNHD